MAATTFNAGTTISKEWLRDVNRRVYTDTVSVKSDPYLATGDGTTDDYTAINTAKTAASGKTLFFPPGTYVIGTSITLANVALAVGAILKPSAGVTVTISSFADAPDLSQHFSGGGSVALSAGSVAMAFQEWWYDGGGNYTPALTALANSLPANNLGIACGFLPKVYTYTTAFTMPTGGTQNKLFALVGLSSGGGGTNIPTLSVSVQPGEGNPCFNFSAGDCVLRMENLAFIHTVSPAVAANGDAIKLPQTDSQPNGTYSTYKNLWIQYFNRGIVASGYQFYCTFEQIRTIQNRAAGADFTGSILNGSSFRACNFSQTTAGTGFIGSTMQGTSRFENTYFEGNSVYGANISGYYECTLANCYFENNGDIDIYSENASTDAGSVLAVRENYFVAGTGARRIRCKRVRLILEGNRFFQTPGGTNSPVLVELNGGTADAFSQPHIAINNVYKTATLSDDDSIWFIVDSKHPIPRSSNAQPNNLSTQVGDFWYNRGTTNREILGWIANEAGWVSAPAVTPTATTTLGSNTITLNSTAHQLTDGEWIQIAGVTFDGLAYVQIGESNPGELVVLSTAGASAAVSGAAITYKTATTPIPIYANTGYIEEYGLSLTSGANTGLFQFSIASGEKAIIEVDGIAGSQGNNSQATARVARCVVANDAAGIDIGTVVYSGTADGLDAATSWTLVVTDNGSGLCRVFATQATGNPLNFGYRAKVINNKVVVTSVDPV